jgi:hypothetical protein
MAQVTKRLGWIGYRVSKHRALRRMTRECDAQRPIVVYTMGKTGNKSVAHALRDALGTRVFRIHRLHPTEVAAAERRYWSVHSGERPMHLWESEYLLGRPPTLTNPWDVVTMVREPIAQAVATFFQSRGGVIDLPRNATGESLARAFVDHNKYRRPLRWFDREFKFCLECDVYQHRFDPEHGYGIIEAPAVRVLILRTESMRVAPQALADFFGLVGPVPLPRHNVSSEKDYAATYRSFTRQAVIPAEILDLAYESRYAQHFYSLAELDRFRSTWERTTALP